jgi:hypothetical protein
MSAPSVLEAAQDLANETTLDRMMFLATPNLAVCRVRRRGLHVEDHTWTPSGLTAMKLRNWLAKDIPNMNLKKVKAGRSIRLFGRHLDLFS